MRRKLSRISRVSMLCSLVLLVSANFGRGAEDLALSLAAIRAVGPKGEGHAAASRAAIVLSDSGVKDLPAVLAGMDGANPLATNWLRVAAEAIAGRALSRGEKLPIGELEAFTLDRSHSPRPRRLAYELIVRVDPSAPERLMPQMLDDTSLELRREAVERILEKAKGANGATAAAHYSLALQSARDLDQLKQCFEGLKAFDRQVDVARHMGYLTHWHLIAPFDNTGGRGFDAAYPPENEVELTAQYDGKEAKVKWGEASTDDAYGIVDLAETLDKFKGAVAYATTEIISPGEQEVQMRLGCINACKLWVNGELIDSREVYHSGMEVDQYITPVKLRSGPNRVLLKICQNEQEESWAQRWQFQLRVTDALGGAAQLESVDNEPASN